MVQLRKHEVTSKEHSYVHMCRAVRYQSVHMSRKSIQAVSYFCIKLTSFVLFGGSHVSCSLKI